MNANVPPLVVLRRQLDLLAELPLPAPANEALRIATGALAELEHSALWLRPRAEPLSDEAQQAAAPVDRQVFDALMEIAGPVVAVELKLQMSADLHAIRDNLNRALVQGDLGLMRDQCHNLTAIAGAAGAFELQLAAGHLGACARQDADDAESSAAIERQLQTVQAALVAVIDFVAQELAPAADQQDAQPPHAAALRTSRR